MLGESLQDFARRKRLTIEQAYAKWHAIGRVRLGLDARDVSFVAAFGKTARAAAHFYLPTEER